MMRLLRERPPGSPAFDTAVSRVLLDRVARAEIEETFRLYRPVRIVAFGGQDANEPGFPSAVAAARAAGFGVVLRLAGGRAAVFHEGTLAFGRAIPDDDPTARTTARFDEMAGVMASALRRLGIDARIGAVPGEYCPGDYSVNARGATKIVGIGQRLVRGGAHVGGVIVAERSDLVRAALIPVYDALGLDWDPDTTGSTADETGATWDDVERAIVAELVDRYEIVEGSLDGDTLALARDLAPRYAPPVP